MWLWWNSWSRPFQRSDSGFSQRIQSCISVSERAYEEFCFFRTRLFECIRTPLPHTRHTPARTYHTLHACNGADLWNILHSTDGDFRWKGVFLKIFFITQTGFRSVFHIFYKAEGPLEPRKYLKYIIHSANETFENRQKYFKMYVTTQIKLLKITKYIVNGVLSHKQTESHKHCLTMLCHAKWNRENR